MQVNLKVYQDNKLIFSFEAESIDKEYLKNMLAGLQDYIDDRLGEPDTVTAVIEGVDDVRIVS